MIKSMATRDLFLRAPEHNELDRCFAPGENEAFGLEMEFSKRTPLLLAAPLFI